MAEKDGDTWYCFYAVMKLHWKPSDFAFLPERERALLCAFIDERVKQEDKQNKRLKSESSTKRGRRG
jgi:hypothetical protein